MERYLHPLVANGDSATGRDERGEPVDVPGREAQRRRSAYGFGQALDELVVADLLRAVEGKGRARPMARRPLQPSALGAADA